MQGVASQCLSNYFDVNIAGQNCRFNSYLNQDSLVKANFLSQVSSYPSHLFYYILIVKGTTKVKSVQAFPLPIFKVVDSLQSYSVPFQMHINVQRMRTLILERLSVTIFLRQLFPIRLQAEIKHHVPKLRSWGDQYYPFAIYQIILFLYCLHYCISISNTYQISKEYISINIIACNISFLKINKYLEIQAVFIQQYGQTQQQQQLNITSMQFLRVQGPNVIFKNLFNEQHASELLSSIHNQISSISFQNVGIKIMKLILAYFEEAPITTITVDYNWNTIMTTPQLVCYDKNQWKTLQQLANWNREWNELFNPCYSAAHIELKVHCSWMDDQFAQKLLEGVLRLPNINSVAVELSSKSAAVENILSAFAKAGLFNQFKYGFKLQK